MSLEDLGYNDNLEQFRINSNLDRFVIGRVIAEHKERYIVKTVSGEYEAEVTGKMRFKLQKAVKIFRQWVTG